MEAKDRVKIITDWIKDYVESMDTPANCLVVGVSGGIDSSVVSTLCARTGIKTLVASMPISQRPEHHDLSIKHKNWLTTKYQNAYSVEIDLTGTYLSFENCMIDKKFTEKFIIYSKDNCPFCEYAKKIISKMTAVVLILRPQQSPNQTRQQEQTLFRFQA